MKFASEKNWQCRLQITWTWSRARGCHVVLNRSDSSPWSVSGCRRSDKMIWRCIWYDCRHTQLNSTIYFTNILLQVLFVGRRQTVVPLTHTRNMDYTHILDHDDRERAAVPQWLARLLAGSVGVGSLEPWRWIWWIHCVPRSTQLNWILGNGHGK